MVVRGVFKTLIAVFCIWHVSAVGIYSLYGVEDYPVLAWLNTKREHVRPYMLMTSQWQRWNLFSPDPLRRVIQMGIDVKVNGTWQPHTTVNQETIDFWRRATELKTLRRMEDLPELQKRYLHVYCYENGIATGTEIRMRKEWFVIPKHNETLPAEWWDGWEPNWNDDLLVETTCPEIIS